MTTAGAIATAGYLLTALAVLQLWATHYRHTGRPWGYLNLSATVRDPLARSFAVGYVVVLIASLASAMLVWRGSVSALTVGGSARVIAGMVLVVSGWGLAVVAQQSMGRSWRIGVDRARGTPLVMVGPFRLIRNPVLTALIMIQIGASVISPTWLALLATALLVAVCEVQVRRLEEPYLAQVHPQTYPRYAVRVGRFVPGVGTIKI